jgi:hypothetical protein
MTRIKPIVVGIAALILYLATLALGLLDIYFAREIVWAIYARFSTNTGPALLIGNSVVVILALVYLVFVVVSGEYHQKNVGQARSWKLFGGTFAVELFVPILAYFV